MDKHIKLYYWIMIYCVVFFAVALTCGTTFDQIVIGVSLFLSVLLFASKLSKIDQEN